MSCGPCVEFSQKLGTLLPSREFALDLPTDVDLADATAVNFVWRPKGSADRNVIALVVVDPSSNLVRLDFDAASVAAVGYFEYQFEITISGKVLAIPDRDFYVYEVTKTI